MAAGVNHGSERLPVSRVGMPGMSYSAVTTGRGGRWPPGSGRECSRAQAVGTGHPDSAAAVWLCGLWGTAQLP